MSILLSILLLILKIIGIVLLLILAILCLILLVPIRYGFELSAPEGGALSAGAQVTWFRLLLRCRAAYLEKKLSYEIRILGFRLLSNDPEYLK
ncbi:MAG: hypothetical protein IKX76_06820, partial [Eubacterium sp.]|nr:hypothetical protein [Eubacterium sp.]